MTDIEGAKPLEGSALRKWQVSTKAAVHAFAAERRIVVDFVGAAFLQLEIC